MSDPLIDRLVEQRASAAKALHDHLDAVSAETRGADDAPWSAESDAKFSAINADLDGLDARIKSLADAEARQADADEARAKYGEAAKPPAGDQAPVADDGAILRSLLAGERRAHDFPFERRDLTVASSTGGGNTVPTGFLPQLQEHMIQTAAIRQTNVQVLTTASGEPLQVPKTTSHPTAAIIGEGSSITESNPAFGQVTLDSYKYAVSVQVSRELLEDTAVDLVGYLARAFGRALGNKSGTDYIVGDGSSKPYGVATGSTVGVTGATSVSGAFTAANLIDLFYSVIAPYRNNASWLLSDVSLAAVRKLTDPATGQYLWQPGLQLGQPDMLLGKPLVSDYNVASPAIDAKSVLFGDFSAYMIRDVAGVRLERSDDFAFLEDLATWKAILRTDGDLIDTTGAVKAFKGGAS